MIPTGRRDLAVNRWAPFQHTIDFVGFDWAGATFNMQVRKFPDATGSALITLGNASSPSEGISVTTETVDGKTTSHVQIRINETTIEGIEGPGAGTLPQGADVSLFYDLQVTATGLPKNRILEGFFTIRAGVTQ